MFADRLLHQPLVALIEQLFGVLECRIDHPGQAPEQRFACRKRHVVIFVEQGVGGKQSEFTPALGRRRIAGIEIQHRFGVSDPLGCLVPAILDGKVDRIAQHFEIFLARRGLEILADRLEGIKRSELCGLTGRNGTPGAVGHQGRTGMQRRRKADKRRNAYGNEREKRS
ncbi:MAG: hypothetical protein H3C55_07795 [Pseudorhodoplanes sp.]|nr:hypothetical protein [Pseudorhodoplanes sp.]